MEVPCLLGPSTGSLAVLQMQLLQAPASRRLLPPVTPHPVPLRPASDSFVSLFRFPLLYPELFASFWPSLNFSLGIVLSSSP